MYFPPLKNPPSKAIGFVYSPLWKIIHQSPIGFVYSPLWKITHHDSSVLCTPPFEKSPITIHRFCVLPALKNPPSQSIGFVYSPLWKTSVLGGRLFRQKWVKILQNRKQIFEKRGFWRNITSKWKINKEKLQKKFNFRKNKIFLNEIFLKNNPNEQ